MYVHHLPKQYKKLAERNRKACKGIKAKNFSEDDLRNAFVWSSTPEGGEFWQKVHYAKSEDDLPPIPEVV